MRDDGWTSDIGTNGSPRRQDTATPIPGLDVAIAKRYSRTKLGVLLGGTAWSLARLAWFSSGRRSVRLREALTATVPDPRFGGAAYVGVTTVLGWIGGLPVAYFGGHLVERRFGLTKQRDRAWLADEAKGLGLTLAVQVPLTTAVYALIRRRPRDWWVVLAGATVPFGVLLSALGPVLIMPIFNRFEVLRDPALAARVQALAFRAGVPIADVYQMDMSRQTEKPNAFFTGLGATKRIVLSDTLIDGFTPDEIEGIVAHELGHQVHGDIWRLVALGGGMGFAGAYALHRLAPLLIGRTRDRTGVTSLGDEASLPLLALLMTLLGFVAAPAQAAVSRAIERRTDGYALDLTRNGDAYASAMERLAVRALADPDPPSAVVFFLYSHPPIARRIAAARDHAAAGRTAEHVAGEVD